MGTTKWSPILSILRFGGAVIVAFGTRAFRGLMQRSEARDAINLLLIEIIVTPQSLT